MTTARMIASRLLETDEDFDPQAELKRYTARPYPNIEIESEFNHWNVYNVFPEGRMRLGAIYYDDMTDAPIEVMSPEARQYHETHRWTSCPSVFREQVKGHASFKEAVDALVPLALRHVREAEEQNPDDPEAFIRKFSKERGVPVEMEIFNNLGRRFRVRIVWDKPAGGTTYDDQGNVEPEKLQPIVEFYDMEHARDPDYANSSVAKNGQFVSSYYAATLMERPTGGINLCGHEPVWQIDARAMDKVRAWIKSEVEGRGYRLVNDEAGGVSFGMRYEGLDPDDPELYTHPERYTAQPSDEKIEGTLRRMLSPYYTRVSINKRPGMWANREIIQRNIPDQPEGTENRIPFKDSWIWTIHCNRDTPLPLPPTRPYVGHRGPDPNSWRSQVESWFEKWAKDAGLYLFHFEIYGRLRKDPTFHFETARIGPLKESDDDVDQLFAHYAKTAEWDRDLTEALWKFHPYGVGYRVYGFNRGAYVVAETYFEPDTNDFARRFRDFVVNWLIENRIMSVKTAQLYTFPHANRPKDYPEWSAITSINVPWADPDLPEHLPTIHIGEPGTAGSDPPKA